MKQIIKRIQARIFRAVFGKHVESFNSRLASLNQTVELFGLRLAAIEDKYRQSDLSADDEVQASAASAHDAGQAAVEARSVAIASKKIAAQIAFDPDELAQNLKHIHMRINNHVKRFVRIEDTVDGLFDRTAKLESDVNALDQEARAQESWFIGEINKLLDVINQSSTKG